ncbi:DUF58 domain-containing protein [Candidatus Gracilibacteria bacterium]|nr:DUF58 domain-containing protein [Candidatus Gracilibacteria bacterium]
MKQGHKHISFKSSKLMEGLFIGNFKAAFSGRGIEFQDFREYSSGDDAKYIDWARSSQEGTTIMRRYREDKQGTILTIIDHSQSLYYEAGNPKIKLIQDILELIGQASIKSGENFGGYIIGENELKYIPAKKSIISLHKILGFTEISPRNTKTEFSLSQINKSSLKKSVIFVLSDSLTVDERSIKILSHKHDVIYIHISTYFENTLEGTGIEVFSSGTASLGMNLSDETKKQEYQLKRKQKLKDFQKSMHLIGVDTLFLHEQSSLFAEFLKLMKAKEQRNIF